ncbi:MAG TPA: hypothetical protein VD996_06125 [Chitinophagaceae bacterium]|nr:hypothetical protein [Chitinophagaceae bacterium]
MLGKLFGWSRKKNALDPNISFGRYSDNNKTVAKIARWTEAEKLFRENKRHECLDAFFDYLQDDAQRNVIHERRGEDGVFALYQGSKIVRGSYDSKHLRAEVTLARMPRPAVPVMRRLLEMNFNLFYSRFAKDGDRLCMRFDSELDTATPNKLYYGLKELATKADKQDDLLVQNFATLQPTDTDHIQPMPDAERETRYNYLQKWIRETLEYIATLDPDKFSGGIAYLLLTLAYRIDYLISPEGPVLSEIEVIPEIYFKKDNRAAAEKNHSMIEAFHKLQARTKEQVFPFLFRSRHTFSIVTPQNYKTIADVIKGAHQNMHWYRDNSYPFIASRIIEYGVGYCQYSYSLPKPLSDLFRLFMNLNYNDYFRSLGFATVYYDGEKKEINKDEVEEEIDEIIEEWKSKYPRLQFNKEALRYDSLLNFNYSFTREIINLRFD